MNVLTLIVWKGRNTIGKGCVGLQIGTVVETMEQNLRHFVCHSPFGWKPFNMVAHNRCDFFNVNWKRTLEWLDDVWKQPTISFASRLPDAFPLRDVAHLSIWLDTLHPSSQYLFNEILASQHNKGGGGGGGMGSDEDEIEVESQSQPSSLGNFVLW